MEPTETIRTCLAQVALLRQHLAAQPALEIAVSDIKRFQALRFASTYADLLAGGPYQAATRFFLDELYGETNYAERDEQFSRIAGAIQRLLPRQAAQTAVSLAQLHALSEQLDHAMGNAWLSGRENDQTLRYVHCWRAVGSAASRRTQLQMVLEIGAELIRLTRTPGLRIMLKIMRGPAHAAGLGALQHFLEAGFDTFANLEKKKLGAQQFLRLIQERETRLIEQLFEADIAICHAALAAT